MRTRIADDETDNLIDPTAVPDIFVTGTCVPEIRGGHIRLTHYAERRSAFGEIERVIVARLVFTLEDFMAAHRRIAGAFPDRDRH